MKKNLTTVLLLTTTFLIHGQIYEMNDRKIAFAGEANIREGASLNAKVIGVLKQGEEVIVCAKTHIPDTISGVIASWVPILYNGHPYYIWGNSLATNFFKHQNGNLLLVKNDLNGLSYKVLANKKLITSGTFKDRPYEQYSYFHLIQPLSAIKNSLYFKLSDSDNIYRFDGMNVVQAGKTEKENIKAIHQSSRKEIIDSLGSIINRDKVNFRSKPNIESEIIGQLPLYAFVEELEKLSTREQINNEENYWYKIKWKDITGYIWGASISSPIRHIHDNDDKNTSYLLCNNALFVINKHQIVAHTMLRTEVYDQTLHSFGDLGFGKGYDFVAIEFIAHGCGKAGGDMYYLWDGKKIKYFCFDYGIGDGPMSEGESYVFPSFPNATPGILIKNSYSSQMIDIITVDDCEVNYVEAIEYNISAILSYNGDTLVEVPSKHLEVKQLIRKEFPDYMLAQYEFVDINSDSIEDVVFQIRMDRSTYEDGYYNYNIKTKIGVAFGAPNGKFTSVKVNEHIAEEKEESATKISFNGSEIIITVYSKDRRKIYSFMYNSIDKKIYWESITTVYQGGLNKLKFKTKKILFEDSWNFSQDSYEGDGY